MATETDEQKAASEFGLRDLPEGWRPAEGSVLIGTVVDITKGWSDEKESYYPILVVHDEITDKDVAVHAFHTSLKDKMVALRPVPGERVGIKMGPKVPLKSNPTRSVVTYLFKIDGRSEDVWNEVRTPRANAPAAQTQGRLADVEADTDDDIPF